MAMRWLVPRLARFQAMHPDVSVQITTTLDPVNLVEDEADITARYGNAETGLCHDLLMPEIIVPVCAPSRASGPPAIERPEQIWGNVLLHSLKRAHDWKIWFDAVGFPIEQPINGVSFETSILAYQAALGGVGFAIAQLALVRGELESGRLVAPVYRPVHTGRTFFLACLKEKANLPAVAKFRAWAIEEVARDHARFGMDIPQPDRATGKGRSQTRSPRLKKKDTRLET